MSNQSAHPLAWSQAGDPIELSPAAVLWRVRRLNGGSKGGAPEIVYGGDGLPLVVDIAVTPDDFADAVERRGGKYRLDALDESKRLIPNVPPAYVMVAGPLVRESAAADEDTGAIERVVKTLAETMRSQSTQIGQLVDACARLVNAVDSAGVSKREPPPQQALVPVVAPQMIEVAPAVSVPAEPQWWQPFVAKALEMAPTLLPLAIRAFAPGGGVPGAAGATVAANIASEVPIGDVTGGAGS